MTYSAYHPIQLPTDHTNGYILPVSLPHRTVPGVLLRDAWYRHDSVDAKSGYEVGHPLAQHQKPLQHPVHMFTYCVEQGRTYQRESMTAPTLQPLVSTLRGMMFSKVCSGRKYSWY